MKNWNKEQIEQVIDLYTSGRTLKEVSNACNISTATITKFLKENNIKRRRVADYIKLYNKSYQNLRTYTLNENYFDEIDTSNKAYILGFLYADGYNDEKNGSITVALNSKDRYVLEHILSECGSNAKIKEKTVKSFEKYKASQMVEVKLHSKKMSRDLTKWGCMQNKTYKITFPDFLSENLYSHFIRGYFDGDGCIYRYQQGIGVGVSFVSNLNFLKGLTKFLCETLCLEEKSIKSIKTVGVVNFYSEKDITAFYNYIYENSCFHLSRKFERFQSFFTRIQDRTLKYDDLSTKIINLYRAGKSLPQISKELKIGVNTAYRRILKIDSSLIRSRGINKEGFIKTKNLYNKGKTTDEIMNITGLSKSSVYRYINTIKNRYING